MSLQTARIVWFGYIVAACLFISVAHLLRPNPDRVLAASLKWIFTGIAAADLLILGNLRRAMLEKSQEKLQRGETTQAQASCSVAQMLGFATCMSVVLFGFVLKILGAAPTWFSAIFYFIGIGLLILWSPRPYPATCHLLREPAALYSPKPARAFSWSLAVSARPHQEESPCTT